MASTKHEMKNRKNSVKPSGTLKILHAIREWHEVNLNMTETRNIAETICKIYSRIVVRWRLPSFFLARESTQRGLPIDSNQKRDFQLISAAMKRNMYVVIKKKKNFGRESIFAADDVIVDALTVCWVCVLILLHIVRWTLWRDRILSVSVRAMSSAACPL